MTARDLARRAAAAVALALMASHGVVRAADVLIPAGQTRTLQAGGETSLSGERIVNDGLIFAGTITADLIASDRIVNSGSIHAQSAQVRLRTPLVEHHGLFVTRGAGAAINLNPDGLPLQTITGGGVWDVENGLNAGGRIDVTAGPFLVRPDTLIALGGAGDSRLSVAHLFGGGAGVGSVQGFTLGGGSDLVIRDGGGQTFASDMNGGFRLVKEGAGTQTLTGALTHTGGTVVNGGTLRVSNPANAAGLGNVEVNAGATLAASGAINSFTRVRDGGTLTLLDEGKPGKLSTFGLRMYPGATLMADIDGIGGKSDLLLIANADVLLDDVTLDLRVGDALPVGGTAWFVQWADTLFTDGVLIGQQFAPTAADFDIVLPVGYDGFITIENELRGGLNYGRVGFTLTAVPEPTSLAMPAVAAAFSLLRRRRRRAAR